MPICILCPEGDNEVPFPMIAEHIQLIHSEMFAGIRPVCGHFIDAFHVMSDSLSEAIDEYTMEIPDLPGLPSIVKAATLEGLRMALTAIRAIAAEHEAQ